MLCYAVLCYALRWAIPALRTPYTSSSSIKSPPFEVVIRSPVALTGTENEYELRLASERNAKQRSRHENFSVVVAATLRGNWGGPTETITAALNSKNTHR